MADDKSIAELAQAFAKLFFHKYLEERNFPWVIAHLHKDVSWVGTGEHEVCRDFEDGLRLLDAEEKCSDSKFRIIREWYSSNRISEDTAFVYGEIMIVDSDPESIPLEMPSRFSGIFVRDGNEFLLMHTHFSVSNPGQSNGEFTHKALVDNYNKLLEQKLVERTELLKQKTRELEALTNNIYGGLELCDFDERFTIRYVNHGFCELTGYAAEDLLKGNHAAIVYPPDAKEAFATIHDKLIMGEHFSTEYRIVRKDGRVIWVLDNGSVLPVKYDGMQVVQCILTDITKQKEQEEALRVNERRYQTVMQLSEITIFEYNIVDRTLTFVNDANLVYGVSSFVPGGSEELIASGAIDSEDVPAYRRMYREIHAGAATAQCFIKVHSVNGATYDFKLTLTAIYDDNGKPVRAIGVRKNVSEIVQLQREEQFSKTMVADKIFLYEVNITTDTFNYVDTSWFPGIVVAAGMPYYATLDRVNDLMIAPEHRELVQKSLSMENIMQKLNDGNSRISYDFLRLSPQGEQRWYHASVNIVRDVNNHSLLIRLYLSDIHEQKKKALIAAKEQQLYEAMVAKATLAYDVNITQNLMLSGHEQWENMYHIEQTNCYSDMITRFAHKVVHPEDSLAFEVTISRENVLAAHSRGQFELECQYRKPNANGDYVWFCCTIHLYEDPDVGDIKGFYYVEDIDAQKNAELALHYNAEHDRMTGLYNKDTAKDAIDSFLQSPTASSGYHAFLMIDIDFFKSINDNFGHQFGDEVLTLLAKEIRATFRNDDIIGRVGGDEFCVLMKDVPRHRTVLKKVEELRRKLIHSYTRGGASASISASIGIATYPEHGSTYDELFRHSDYALYDAKRNGKNRYAL